MATIEHSVIVNGLVITIVDGGIITSNNVGVDRLTVTFDEFWDEVDYKRIVFKNGKVSVGDVYEDGMTIPFEVLKRTGRLYITIIGYVGDEKVVATKKMVNPFSVIASGNVTAGSTPSAHIPSEIRKIFARADEAANIAEAIRAEADAGRFDGKPGDKGDPFTYEDFTDAQLDALRGPKGDDGKTPVKGVDYFDGKDGRTPIKGIDYFDGQPGDKGDPFRFDDFTAEQLESLRGPKGDDGYTPIKGIDYFDGQPGADGAPGNDGYTPVKGVDYFDGKPGADGAPGNDGHTPTDEELTALIEPLVPNVPDSLRAKAIAAGATSFDSITTQGTYYVTTANSQSMSNAPEKNYGLLTVMFGSDVPGNVCQTYVSGSGGYYTRIKTSGGWGAWAKVNNYTDASINALIDARLGVIEGGSY